MGGLVIRVLAALLVAVSVVAPARPAGAHVEQGSAEPAPGTTVPASPGRIEITLTEPSASLSRISLLGPDGEPVEVGATRVSGRKLAAPVPALRPGDYTVRWAAFSALDGHLAGGSYRFRVGHGRLAETRTGGLLPGTVVAVWSRLLVLGGGLLWAGAAVLALLAARSSTAREPDVGFLAAFGARLRRLVPWAVAAALWGEVIALWMAGRGGLPVWTAGFLTGSATGRLVLGRVAVLAAGLVVSWRVAAGRSSPVVHGPVALAYLGLVAFSGHAVVAPAGPLSGPMLDLVHLVAAAAWLGGIALLGLLARPRPEEASGVAALAQRFSAVALVAATTLWITGVFATEQQTLSFSDLPGTVYGRILVVKLVLVALLVAMSLRTAFVLRPALVRAARDSVEAAGLADRLLRHLRLEAPVAVAIIACVALMTSRASPLTLTAATGPGTGRPPLAAPVLATQDVGDRSVALSIAPGTRGPNRLVVSVDGPSVAQVRLRLDGPDGPGAAFSVPAEDGLTVTEVDFPSAGQWIARIGVDGADVEFPFGVADATGDEPAVLTVADLSGPARERCRAEVAGQRAALAEVDRPIAHLVVDVADAGRLGEFGRPSVVLGGCGVDADLLRPFAGERGIPFVAPEGGEGGPSTWAIAPGPDAEGPALARLGFEALSGRSAAVVFEAGDRARQAAEAFRAQFSSAGGTVAGLWEGSGPAAEATVAAVGSLEVDFLVLFGAPEAVVPLAEDLDRRGWRPVRGVLASSSLFGPELPDAAGGWRDKGLVYLAGYHSHDAQLVAAYVRGLLETVPGELPSYRGVTGYVEGAVLADALDAAPAAGRLDRSLDTRFREGWKDIPLAWSPGRHAGAPELALFQFTPPLNIFGILGGAHAAHEIGGGLLYDRGDFQRATAWYGATGEPRQE